MKRHAIAYMAAVVSLSAVFLAVSPCQAQLLKQLEQGLMGGQQGQLPGAMAGQQGQIPGAMFGQQQGAMFGQQAGATLLGNVNLPPAQYMLTNLQTNQAFYVTVQNGQMYLTGQPGAAQTMMPGQGMMPQQGGMGGLMNGGLGKFLKNELQQQQGQQQLPGQ